MPLIAITVTAVLTALVTVGLMARAAGVSVTRIAQGVPMGGELEYVDAGTLSHAFRGRQTL